MAADLSALNYQEFEMVVAALVARSGHRIVAQAKPGQRGPDFEAITPSGHPLFVIVKHYQIPLPRVVFGQFAEEITRYQLQVPDAKGLVVTSSNLTAAAVTEIKEQFGIDIWTGDEVIDRLNANPDLLAAVHANTAALHSLRLLSMASAPPAEKPASALYAERLTAITPGRTDWRVFETWCTDILAEIFQLDLGPPDRQIRTDDGLDIMDAIFPIRAGVPPWSQVRTEFTTRFVIAEYKNYREPIGQKQVESIAQYLWAQAKRQFGILVSRDTPAPSALTQRRRVWVDASKMVVFLTDHQLIDMLQMREADEEPFTIIDAQLEEFLRTLTP